MKGKLVLETGEVFEGELLGKRPKASVGETVFTTGMTGYQETLSDPSYCEQIVVCTTPHVGNVGINPWDMESRRVQVAGLVAQSICDVPASWRSHGNLQQWLEDAEVPLLSGVETRALTLRLRDIGVVKGWIGPATTTNDRVEKILKDAPSMNGRDLVRVVSTLKAYPWTESTSDIYNQKILSGHPTLAAKVRVAVIDLGVKFSILRQMVDAGFEVMVFPSRTSAKEVLQFAPHGIFLSNGPGDPSACGETIETIRELLGSRPLFGICMGHQLLGLALGAKTYKLPYGHRAINHPVRNIKTNRIEITSHNHGFAVDLASLPPGVECTHISMNDNTVEGLACPSKKAFSVQYHPESCPGPHDSGYLFTSFLELMRET